MRGVASHSDDRRALPLQIRQRERRRERGGSRSLKQPSVMRADETRGRLAQKDTGTLSGFIHSVCVAVCVSVCEEVHSYVCVRLCFMRVRDMLLASPIWHINPLIFQTGRQGDRVRDACGPDHRQHPGHGRHQCRRAA